MTVSRNCMRHLIVMGWVTHGASVLSMGTALATDHWLRRQVDGEHAGILPCCPKLKCGNSNVSINGENIETFTDIIIVGMLLVGFGWILSLTHSCVTWRKDKKTLTGLSYLASTLITAGGIILVAAAIEFIITIPGDMENTLERECKGQANRVGTGFSYKLFVTSAVTFIVAGIFLFLGSCKHNSPDLISRNGIRHTTVVAVRSFDRSLGGSIDFTAEHRRISETSQQMLWSDYPEYEDGIFQLSASPPSYESINGLFSHQRRQSEAGIRGPNPSQDYCCISISSPLVVQHPPTYDDSFKDQPPPYTNL